MSVCTLRINDHDLAVPIGTTVLEAARQGGIHILTLCFLEGISVPGGNRR